MTELTLDAGLEDCDHSRFTQLLIDPHPFLLMTIAFFDVKRARKSEKRPALNALRWDETIFARMTDKKLAANVLACSSPA
jgi:hypothetical protein